MCWLGSDDTVQRLLWRLKNGELPTKNQPRVAVVLIGTNDLTSPGCSAPSAGNLTAAELRGLLVYMHRHTPFPYPKPWRFVHVTVNVPSTSDTTRAESVPRSEEILACCDKKEH